jgi:hypothetical protein
VSVPAQGRVRLQLEAHNADGVWSDEFGAIAAVQFAVLAGPR